MESTNGMKLIFTRHAEEQIEAKGFDKNFIVSEFPNVAEDKISPNKKFEGQFRVVVGNVCLVGAPMYGMFRVFTLYEDGVMTPPRPDQMNTIEGQRYAHLYEKMQREKNRTANNGNMKRKNEYWPRVHERRSEIGHRLIK